MGRGERHRQLAQAARAAVQLRGDELVACVYLHRSAIENWARLSGGPANLHDARFALLDTIRASGAFSSDPPGWMTSPKPGLAGYLTLPGDLLLTAKDNQWPDGRQRLLLTNCVASRRNRASRRPELNLKRDGWPEVDVNNACRRHGIDLARTTVISLHCRERLSQRGGWPNDSEAVITAKVKELIAASGRVVATPPAWADAAGHGEPVLLCELDDDLLALPLVLNRGNRDGDYVATTCLPRSWSQASLSELSGDALAAAVHLPRTVIRDYADNVGAAQEPTTNPAQLTARIASVGAAGFDADGRAVISLPEGHLLLRPMSATTEHEGASGRVWLAQQFRPRT
jgi:hypothetical protein